MMDILKLYFFNQSVELWFRAVVFAVGQQGSAASGEAHCHPEASPGGWWHVPGTCTTDGSCHPAASHTGDGASARWPEEQPLPSHPAQHQITSAKKINILITSWHLLSALHRMILIYHELKNDWSICCFFWRFYADGMFY